MALYLVYRRGAQLHASGPYETHDQVNAAKRRITAGKNLSTSYSVVELTRRGHTVENRREAKRRANV